jgi:transcription initiation factor TFIIIB Brf1 subunit/transcription initiation factor TFIIB
MAGQHCPECGGTKFAADQEGFTCLTCGLVIPENYYFEKIAVR